MFGWSTHRDVTVTTLPTPGADELVLDEARRTEASVLALHSNLDQKAGVLLGFAGVLVTLLAGTSTVLPAWARVAAALVATLAGVSAAVPISARPPGLVAPVALLTEGVAERERADAVSVVTNAIAFLVVDSMEKLRTKNRWLRAAAVLLGVAVFVVLVGLIVVSVEGGTRWAAV